MIYVFATHVNRSENRKIDRFTASRERVDAQKLGRAFAVCVCVCDVYELQRVRKDVAVVLCI